MTYRDRQVLEVILKPHQQQNVRPWEPEPFDLPPVEPLPESRWLNDKHPDEEEEKRGRI